MEYEGCHVIGMHQTIRVRRVSMDRNGRPQTVHSVDHNILLLLQFISESLYVRIGIVRTIYFFRRYLILRSNGNCLRKIISEWTLLLGICSNNRFRGLPINRKFRNLISRFRFSVSGVCIDTTLRGLPSCRVWPGHRRFRWPFYSRKVSLKYFAGRLECGVW